MPDCQLLADLHAAAVAAIGMLLTSRFQGRRLTKSELAVYRAHEVTDGFRISVAYEDKNRNLDLIIPSAVPYVAPKIVLVDPPPPLTWPHLENDGTLCLTDGNLTIDVKDPCGVALELLRDADRLIRENIAGTNQRDFFDEFHSYWHRAAGLRGKDFLTLIRVGSPSRLIHAWRGEKFVLLADGVADISTWLENRFGKPAAKTLTSPAIFTWLDKPLKPKDYPNTSADTKHLLEHVAPESLTRVEELARSAPDKITLVMGAPTTNGPCLAGLTLERSAAVRFSNKPKLPYLDGFRPGRVPPVLLASSYLEAVKPAAKSDVTRVDASWIHGRGQDLRQPLLAGTKVVIVGCGSVGGHVAVLLAQAGLGRLVLVDPQTLEWSNIGRHPLGARWIDFPKASSLVTELRERFPHGSFHAYCKTWETIASEVPAVFDETSLVVNATGSWMSNSAMDTWIREHRGPRVLYGWTESHACAGHAVSIGPDGPCLECGFDRLGHALMPVTIWPAGPTDKREPACGAVFQPYGPVELMSTVQLVSGAALALLTNETTIGTHWVYATATSFLNSCGGKWNPVWAAVPGWRPEGAGSFTRHWQLRDDCGNRH